MSPKRFEQYGYSFVAFSSPILYMLCVVSLAVSTGCSNIYDVTGKGARKVAESKVITTISPGSGSVKSGGSLQFRATVTGTTQPGVTWVASAGSITAAGLFKAPAVASATDITISATSLADAKSRASATIHVTAPPPAIRTTSVPGGRSTVSYSTKLEGTGGETPYQWSISGGALPSGLHLDASSGTVSGTPSLAGDSSFVAQLTDKDGQVAQRSLILTVSDAASSESGCGPPVYPCSRTDFAILVPTAPPQLGKDPMYYGGHKGAGMVAIDPAYGNRILRVTDGETDPETDGMSFVTSWSAEANLISSDESLFFVNNEGSTPCLFQFNRAAFKATFRGCRYSSGPGNLQFGYTPEDASAFYNYAGSRLYRFVIDRSTWLISRDPAFNQGRGYFNPDGPQCLNGQLAAQKENWYVQNTSLSSDDETFIAAMGPQQDISPYVVVWNANKGCRWMNVKTWEVSAGWNTGTANPVKISWVSGTEPKFPGGMHNVQLDRSGQYAVLTINGTTLATKVFWDVDTNVVNDTCAQCWSHWACDFGVCFWAFGPPGQPATMRDLEISPLLNMSSMMGKRNLPVTPSQPSSGVDEHVAHQNASRSRKNIYLLEQSLDSGGFAVGGLWDNELIGVNWDGTKRTIRFNKTWSSRFSGCPISRLGHFAICSSDYQMYNKNRGFGSGLNQDTCDHKIVYGGRGTQACRSDVLLFELR